MKGEASIAIIAIIIVGFVFLGMEVSDFFKEEARKEINIEININKEEKEPEPDKLHQTKGVSHDDTRNIKSHRIDQNQNPVVSRYRDGAGR